MSNKQDRDAEKNQAAAPIPTTEREKTIVRTSILGIVANVLLAAFKAVVGVVSNSIAITLDAVNNLSDALSSVITIVGTKLAGRAPDKRHPMGYGRIEYLTAMVISIIVLYAGITSAVESVQKIVSPEAPDYSAAALVVVAAGVVAKVLLGRHVQSVGRRVNADSLVASGQDALSDAVLSVSTLGAAVVYLAWGISLEAWVGAVISAFIVKAGLEMLWQTLSQILGERVSRIVAAHDHVLQFHGFHVDEARHLLEFDVIIAFEAPDRQGEYHQIMREVEEAFPAYTVRATLDSDITD